MTVEEKINNLRYRLEKFRQGLSVRESIVGDGQSLIASKKNSNSVQEFDAILSELNEIVIRQLERLYYWDEIENILVLIVENRVGIDLADRKQYARDIILDFLFILSGPEVLLPSCDNTVLIARLMLFS